MRVIDHLRMAYRMTSKAMKQEKIPSKEGKALLKALVAAGKQASALTR